MNWLYILLGTLPGIIWLLYFIRKDKNPEPRSRILITFAWGALSAVLALFVGKMLGDYFQNLWPITSLTYILAYYFIAVSLVEEVSKFFAVWFFCSECQEFNEPIDAMVYMVTSAMGFATAENVISNVIQANELSVQGSQFITEKIIVNSIYRFLMPTLLHALCSAIVGYFFALAFFRNKKLSAFLGMIIAVIIHGAYDSLSYAFDNTFNFIYVFAILLLLALTVFYVSKMLFNKLRSQQIKENKIIWRFSPKTK